MTAKDYKLSLAERETIITFNADSSTAVVYSCIPGWVSKIKKIKGWKECGAGVEVEVPKTWVKVSQPRTMSETQRKKASERMKKLHSKAPKSMTTTRS